jgi:putative ABC transport system permease protein
MVDESFAGAYALLLLMIAVAMIGVVNFLLAALVSRQRAFRLLHAIGLSAGQMQRAVAVEAALVAVVAVVLGLIAGSLAGFVLVDGAVPALYGWRFSVVIPLRAAAGLATFTLVLAVVASVVPAKLSLRTSYFEGGAPS